MIRLGAAEAAAALGVDRLAADVPGVSTDTRTLRPGDLFVALRGERYDGHAFVPAAFAAGASGAVVQIGAAIAGDPAWEPPGDPGRVYRVVDTLSALGAIARAVRRKSGLTVVAVTGSVGKTGTKDLIRAMASRARRVAATAANENNEVGVPLTLLAVDPDTELVVVEMGMRGRGQIASLAAVAEPDVGVVTKIAPVHLELVGTLADVAAAKAELLHGLRPGGVAVVPADEALLEPHLEDAGRHVVRFSFGRRHPEASVWGSAGSAGTAGHGQTVLHLGWPEGSLELTVPFAGIHRLENAVAAAAACYAAGLPMEQCARGLLDVSFTPGRGDELEVEGILILDHSYNANPTATLTALDDLVQRAESRGGRAVAILGDMLELGADSEAYHAETGSRAAALGVALLVGVGDVSRVMVESFQDAARQGPVAADLPDAPRPTAVWVPSGAGLDAVVSDVAKQLSAGDVVLVKGSRAIGLERAVRVLLDLSRAGRGL